MARRRVHCDQRMRPAVVLFGEAIPVRRGAHGEASAARLRSVRRDRDVLGTVEPASSLVRWAELSGARRLLLNLEVFDGARALFTECHAGPADELVPRWFGERGVGSPAGSQDR